MDNLLDRFHFGGLEVSVVVQVVGDTILSGDVGSCILARINLPSQAALVVGIWIRFSDVGTSSSKSLVEVLRESLSGFSILGKANFS